MGGEGSRKRERGKEVSVRVLGRRGKKVAGELYRVMRKMERFFSGIGERRGFLGQGVRGKL